MVACAAGGSARRCGFNEAGARGAPDAFAAPGSSGSRRAGFNEAGARGAPDAVRVIRAVSLIARTRLQRGRGAGRPGCGDFVETPIRLTLPLQRGRGAGRPGCSFDNETATSYDVSFNEAGARGAPDVRGLRLRHPARGASTRPGRGAPRMDGEPVLKCGGHNTLQRGRGAGRPGCPPARPGRRSRRRGRFNEAGARGAPDARWSSRG